MLGVPAGVDQGLHGQPLVRVTRPIAMLLSDMFIVYPDISNIITSKLSFYKKLLLRCSPPSDSAILWEVPIDLWRMGKIGRYCVVDVDKFIYL